MRVLILEDEFTAAQRSQRMLKSAVPEIVIVDVIDTIVKAVNYLASPLELDLIVVVVFVYCSARLLFVVYSSKIA